MSYRYETGGMGPFLLIVAVMNVQGNLWTYLHEIIWSYWQQSDIFWPPVSATVISEHVAMSSSLRKCMEVW